MELVGVLEGLLFVVGNEGISFDKLMEVLNVNQEALNTLLIELDKQYQNSNRGIRIESLGNKLKLVTKKEHKEYYESLLMQEKNEKLTQAALETLAIIAYNEPVTRLYVDEIRGVESGYLVRKLLYRNLIKEVGRSDAPGRPILYGVTDEFLDYLGLSSIEELPKLENIKEVEKINDLDLYESKYKEM